MDNIEEKQEVREIDSLEAYKEVFEEMLQFVSRYFLIEKEKPTVEEEQFARRLTQLTLRMMSQWMELGMRKGGEPVFNVTCYVKDLSGGVGEMRYAFETVGGSLFEGLQLGNLALKIESAIKDWNLEVFGGELSTKGAEFLEQWGNVIKDK